MDERDIIIGNATTLLMFVFSTVGGGAIINWLGGTSQAGIIIGACLGLGYSILNAYFPNHLGFLKNKISVDNVAETVSEDVEEEETIDENVDFDENSC